MNNSFTLVPLDFDKFIKMNDLKEISNPIFFVKNNMPTPDGLLSNEIFGITKDERANIFAYISLGGKRFLHPFFYKTMGKLDSSIGHIIHGTKSYVLNEKHELVENDNGETGIDFLYKNIDKIKFKTTESIRRDRSLEFIKKFKDRIFIKDMIVIPAYYRDIKTDAGYVGIGDINKLYNNLILAVRSMKEISNYGMSMVNSICGRIQEILLQIYNWLTQEPNIYGKKGILKRANLSKTTDYSTRLVMSAPELKKERLEDLEVDLDHSAIPLSSLSANFFNHMIFYMRRFFENEFSGGASYLYTDKNGKTKNIKVKNYQTEFSDEVLKKEIEKFMYGFSNRLTPILIPNDEAVRIVATFKGKTITEEDYKAGNLDDKGLGLINRPMTWCDLIFMAATEVTKDKTVLITRYPIDSFYNQFATKIRVLSTNETEPILVNGVFYKNYPKIREEDIGSNTSSTFKDTINICNAYLGSIGGDYDGDQVTVKGIYTAEANIELQKQIDSKVHYISLGGKNIMGTTNEGLQSLYNLTLVLSDTRLIDPKF